MAIKTRYLYTLGFIGKGPNSTPFQRLDYCYHNFKAPESYDGPIFWGTQEDASRFRAEELSSRFQASPEDFSVFVVEADEPLIKEAQGGFVYSGLAWVLQRIV